jgi:CelD/BcsL family acetyltransferase involved in cellulose biosynthesis
MTAGTTMPCGSPMAALDTAASMIASVRRASAADRYTGAAFEVECRPLASLASIAEAWRDLAAQAAEPNVFYEPAFALAAAPAFGNDVVVGLVWSGTAPRQLLGFFPVQIDRRYGVPIPVLTGWTHPYAPLGTPLVRRELAEPVIAAWLGHLAANRNMPGVMLMRLLVEDGPVAQAFAAVLTQHQRTATAFDRHERAMLAPGPEGATSAEAAISPKRRKELRRQRRRLEEIGAVRLTRSVAGDISEALRDFLTLEASGWKGRAGTAAAQHQDQRQFLTQAVGELAAEGKATIHRLLVAERPVAAIIMLNSGNTCWCWKIAYDESFAQYSPGVLLSLAVTDTVLADPAIAFTDSCATSAHPMIDHLWRERLTISDQLFSLRSDADFIASLAVPLETLRRTALNAAKALRDHLRGDKA